MPLHSILGYATVGLSGLGLVLAITAALRRSARASRLMFNCYVLCGVVQLPAVATGMIDNAAIPSAATVAPYNVFVGASLLTLTSVLMVWRWLNPEVMWQDGKWFGYLASALGALLLSIALIFLGQMALGGG